MVIYTRFLKFYPATLRVDRFSGVSICIMETFWVNLWFLSIFTQEGWQDPGKRNCLSCICPKHPYFPPKPSNFPYISSPYRAKLKVLDLYAHMDKSSTVSQLLPPLFMFYFFTNLQGSQTCSSCMICK